jgi:pimeloyl-ACP methyl ester carboxylesterase
LSLALIGCKTTQPPVRVTCALPRETSPPSDGTVAVPAKDGTTHSLYWRRLRATVAPAKGTLFYLAGGPISHVKYVGLATAFQASAYPQFDVILYDYFGLDNSSPLQTVAQLESHARGVTVAAMAEDFVHLKRSLVGSSPVYIMGGSHGAMLGAQIVADFPADIAKAVLFSGDTESGWFAEGWFRFDAILTKLASDNPAFATDLEALLARASKRQLTVHVRGKQRVVDRPALEVALWLAAGLSSTVQEALPEMVKAALEGNLEVIGQMYGAELDLLERDASVLTNFHRCNVWFPASWRNSSATARRSTKYLAYESLARYWTELCRAYDHLGEFPQHAMPPHPTAVPIFSWVGERDTFDPDAVRARLARISSRVQLDVMPGWSHDFGPNANEGFRTAAKMVQRFFDER